MTIDFQGTSSIVTGGASGLGAATARRLAERGSTVIVLDLNESAGKELAAEIGGVFVRADVTSTEDVSAAVATAAELAPLRAVVNSAGIGAPERTVARDGSPADLDTFERIVRVNLIGTFNVIRLAAGAMMQTEALDGGERGAIITTASVAAFDGQIGQASYSASKGGIVGMTLPVARDLAASGIRVNCIAPGLFDTPIYGEGEFSENFKANLSKSVPFPHRLGFPDEYATFAVEMLSNSYMNGEVVRVDGAIRLPIK
ncbi:SDR family NAD(P)-dependent oxidoreductase [Aeromicrobium sp.]|uniref:SDR family NAD(P)-dependent oxidoreductase n=1 Tax=Aeromicrobium sp. TaxID=1871063 RepID=UPI003FA61351